VLLVTLHHAVADGWSLGVLSRELGALYAAVSRGEPSPLPEPPVQYADFARWQRSWLSGERRDRQLAYWRRKLGGVKTLDLPLDRARPALQSFRGRRTCSDPRPAAQCGRSAVARERRCS
jgi:hypothetical protein